MQIFCFWLGRPAILSRDRGRYSILVNHSVCPVSSGKHNIWNKHPLTVSNYVKFYDSVSILHNIYSNDIHTIVHHRLPSSSAMQCSLRQLLCNISRLLVKRRPHLHIPWFQLSVASSGEADLACKKFKLCFDFLRHSFRMWGGQCIARSFGRMGWLLGRALCGASQEESVDDFNEWSAPFSVDR